MLGIIDLHTHTTASDGSLSPSELVRYAKKSGLCAVAVTDHDTVGGLKEAHKAAQRLKIEVIDGIELSADYNGELHILGLYIDPCSDAIQRAMQELSDKRAERNEKMIKKLSEMGFDITKKDVLSKSSGSNMAHIGRVHIALALKGKGYADGVQEAFDKYLAVGQGAYVARERFSPKKCIEIIKESGGYAFLAHPIHSKKNVDKLRELVLELMEYGLDGIECYHSSQNYDFTLLCEQICHENSLMISGGSDFHGEFVDNRKLGQAPDGRYIRYDILDNIKRKTGIL